MDDIAEEIRKQKRLEVLGTNNPICVACGEDDWRCFEQHHIAGKAHSNDLSIVCSNCHRKLTDKQKDHPKCNGDPSQLQSIGYWQLGFSDLLALAAETLRQNGHHLIQAEKNNSDNGDHD